MTKASFRSPVLRLLLLCVADRQLLQHIVGVVSVEAAVTVFTVFLAGCGSAPPPPAQTVTKTITIGTPVSPPSSAPPQTTIAAPQAGMGQEARDGNLAFTVTKVEPVTQGELDVFLSVKNLGNSAQTYVAEYQKLIDTEGREFSVRMSTLTSSTNPLAVIQTDINPGVEVNAGLPFNVPTDIEPAKLVLHESMNSPGVTVNLM
jgi:hypothetical protein